MAKTDLHSARNASPDGSFAFEDDELEEAPRAPRKASRRASMPPSPLRMDQIRELRSRVQGQGQAGEEQEESGWHFRALARKSAQRTKLRRWLWGTAAVLGLSAITAGVLGVRHFFLHDPRFLIGSQDDIVLTGGSELWRGRLLGVLGGDVGHNLFEVPLSARQAQLEQISWVEKATVMRLLPNRLAVHIVERTPVAFLRQGNKVGLVDASGVLLDMPPEVMAQRQYSFPVLTGIGAADPQSLRASRVGIYQHFLSDLDSGSEKVSSTVSEVDVSDPEDVKAVLPAAGNDVLAHFGEDHFLERYTSYKTHLAEWRKQYPSLSSVDLRYDTQVVLQMARGQGDSSQPEPKLKDVDTPAEAAGEDSSTAGQATAVQASGVTHHAKASAKSGTKHTGAESKAAKTYKQPYTPKSRGAKHR